MWVTSENLGFAGSTVRKSALTGSVFLQPAFESIIFSVLKRFKSLSNANSCSVVSKQMGERVQMVGHLSLVLHEGA
jgi:hypothetical protein